MGQKQGFIFEGEGEAARVLNEARALSESITNVSQSLKDDTKKDSLRLKLTEQYIQELDSVLAKSKIIKVPAGGAKNDLMKALAGAMAVMNTNSGVGQIAHQVNPALTDEINQKISQLTEEMKSSSKMTDSEGKKYEFMDDKVLYSTE